MLRRFLCKTSVLKVIFIVLNLLFILAGIALIVLGIYLKIDGKISAILDNLDSVSNFDGQSLGYLGFIMIAAGIIILFVAFGGCMGSLWNSRCLINTYIVLVIIVMLLELTGFIMVFVYKGQLGDVYEKDLKTVLSKALNESDIKVLDAFGDMEKKLKCCGINGIEDYHGREPRNPDCFRYRNNCSDALTNTFNDTLPRIGITLGVILLFELFCLISAVLLTISLKGYDGNLDLGYRRDMPLNSISHRPPKYNTLT